MSLLSVSSNLHLQKLFNSGRKAAIFSYLLWLRRVITKIGFKNNSTVISCIGKKTVLSEMTHDLSTTIDRSQILWSIVNKWWRQILIISSKSLLANRLSISKAPGLILVTSPSDLKEFLKFIVWQWG